MKKLLTTTLGKVFQIVALGIGSVGYFVLFLLITQKLEWIPKCLFAFWNNVEEPILCFICLIISMILWLLYQLIIAIFFIIPIAFIKDFIKERIERNDE